MSSVHTRAGGPPCHDGKRPEEVDGFAAIAVAQAPVSRDAALRDYCISREQTLAEYYLGRYHHLVPGDVEIWELDEVAMSIRVLPH